MSTGITQNDLKLNFDRYESKVRGSPMFPCGAYLTDMTSGGIKEIPWHWHEEIEVIVVNAGTVLLNINGENCTLREGEGLFINSNTLHSARAANKTGCILYSLVFSASLLSGTTESVFEQKYVRPLVNCQALPFVPFCRDYEWASQAANRIRDAYDAHDKEQYGYELVVREELTRMWHLLVTNNQLIIQQQKTSEDKDINRVRAMMDFLHNHYAEKISLPQLSAVANISERECLRCFNKITRESPMQYLSKYRISIASRLLSDTGMTITEICTQTGFDNPSHFSRTFKQHMQCTPTSYRKKMQMTAKKNIGVGELR